MRLTSTEDDDAQLLIAVEEHCPPGELRVFLMGKLKWDLDLQALDHFWRSVLHPSHMSCYAELACCGCRYKGKQFLGETTKKGAKAPAPLANGRNAFALVQTRAASAMCTRMVRPELRMRTACPSCHHVALMRAGGGL